MRAASLAPATTRRRGNVALDRGTWRWPRLPARRGWASAGNRCRSIGTRRSGTRRTRSRTPPGTSGASAAGFRTTGRLQAGYRETTNPARDSAPATPPLRLTLARADASTPSGAALRMAADQTLARRSLVFDNGHSHVGALHTGIEPQTHRPHRQPRFRGPEPVGSEYRDSSSPLARLDERAVHGTPGMPHHQAYFPNECNSATDSPVNADCASPRSQ